MLEDDCFSLLDGESTSVNVELWILWGFVWVWDAGKVLDNSFTSLLVKSLDITRFANFERSANMDFGKVKSCCGVDISCEASVLWVGWDESNKNDLAWHCEQLWDFWNTTDVLSSGLSTETKVLVETSTDNITIEDEDLLVVSDQSINLGFQGNRKSWFTTARKASKPVSSTVCDVVGAFTILGFARLVRGVNCRVFASTIWSVKKNLKDINPNFISPK